MKSSIAQPLQRWARAARAGVPPRRGFRRPPTEAFDRQLGRPTCAFVAFLWFASCIWQWRTRDCKEEFQSLAGFGYALVCFCITTLQAFQGGVSVHNAAHCPPFYNEQGLANRLFYLMLTIWNGAPVTAYVPGHNLSHHKYLQTRRDIMRTNKVNFGSQALNIIAFFPSILGSIQSNDFKYMQAQRRKGCAAVRPLTAPAASPPPPRPPAAPAHTAERRSSPSCSRIIWDWYVQEQILFHAVLIALLIADWRKALLIYFLPCGLAKDMLVSLNILQHDGCDAKSKYNHSRNFTSDALNYLLFNNGYHTIHHMKPGVHWSLTKKQHDELVAPYIHPNLLKPSIVGYAIDAHFMGNIARQLRRHRVHRPRPQRRGGRRRGLVLRADVDQRHLVQLRRRLEGGPEGGPREGRQAAAKGRLNLTAVRHLPSPPGRLAGAQSNTESRNE